MIEYFKIYIKKYPSYKKIGIIFISNTAIFNNEKY